MSAAGGCNVCGRQLDDYGTCVCSSGRPLTFNGFLSMVVSDCVNARYYQEAAQADTHSSDVEPIHEIPESKA